MRIFKNSSPKNWSLGSLLLFQQLFPIWAFICFFFFLNIFSLVNVSRKQFGRFLCIICLLGLWEVDRTVLFLWLGLPSVSCFYKVGFRSGPEVLGLLAIGIESHSNPRKSVSGMKVHILFGGWTVLSLACRPELLSDHHLAVHLAWLAQCALEMSLDSVPWHSLRTLELPLCPSLSPHQHCLPLTCVLGGILLWQG